MTFVDKDGEEAQIKVPIGMSMLEAAHENDIDLEGELTIVGCIYCIFAYLMLWFIVVLWDIFRY